MNHAALTPTQEVIDAVANRFRLPAESVREIATTDPETLVQRSRDDEHVFNNTETPTQSPRYPINSVRISPYGGDIDNRYIDYLRDFDPATLTTCEAEQGIKKHPSYERYLQWSTMGMEPPYISVYETESGTLQSTNRRRTLVAQQINKTITGWMGLHNEETGLPLKYGDVRRALEIESTLRLSALAKCAILQAEGAPAGTKKHALT